MKISALINISWDELSPDARERILSRWPLAQKHWDSLPVSKRIVVFRRAYGGNEGHIKHEDKLFIKAYNKNRCVYCGSTVRIEIDHVIPFSKGGTSEVENLVAACYICNRSKRALPLEEWLKKQSCV